jgi:hypothetical protein
LKFSTGAGRVIPISQAAGSGTKSGKASQSAIFQASLCQNGLNWAADASSNIAAKASRLPMRQSPVARNPWPVSTNEHPKSQIHWKIPKARPEANFYGLHRHGSANRRKGQVHKSQRFAGSNSRKRMAEMEKTGEIIKMPKDFNLF